MDPDSAVEDPAMEDSAVEDPAMEDPAVEDPAMEDPAVEDPAMEDPVEDPAVEDPAVEDPAMEDPAVEDPAMEDPAVEDPAKEDLGVVEDPAVTEAIDGGNKIQVHIRSEATSTAVGEGDVLDTKWWDITESILQLKEYLATKLHHKMDKMSLSFHEETLSNTTTLTELGVVPGNDVMLVLHLSAADPSSIPSPRPSSPPSRTKINSDTFTTNIVVGREIKEVLVKVQRSELKKPFLGGYRHKETGLEYHHAAAQTRPRPRPPRDVHFDRDTQTVETRNRYQQATKDAATQMNKNGCFINDGNDKKYLIRGVYETADEYCERVLKNVIILQSYWRRWLAIRFVRDLRSDKLRREEWERAELARRQKERDEHAKKEFYRRMNPRTREDFDLLYHALEMWRQEEIAHIDATTTGPERKAALCLLLELEAQLIASIGRHKVVADQYNKDADSIRFLNKAAAPKRWTAFDGRVTQMNTPYTLRAEQLRDIYSTLVMQNLSQDERLDVLLTVKSTVKEHDCKLTREIVELVDREADLLVREIKVESLRGLRKRISSLFMQYCKTPLFNPEAAKYIKVPQDPSTLCTNVYYCRSCVQYMPSTEFELSANSRHVGHCRACRDLDNQARARQDWTTYRVMLKNLRHTEEGQRDQSHIIFLMQEADLRYLVENIWGGQSALSANKDLYELRMVRWHPKLPWAPWNCVLLTQDEAASHSKLEDMGAAYGPHFVQKVQHRHILAQNYFSHVPEMAKEFKHKVQDLPLPRSREKTIVVTMGKVGGAQEGRRTEEEGRAEEDPSQEGEQSRGDCEPPTKELETA